MKIIVFRFFGGALDGEAMRSDQPRGLENEAEILWKNSWEGTVGRRFDVSSRAPRSYARYQVMSKYELDNEVHVTCEHVS